MIFEMYKPNQGKNTRLFSGFGLAAIVGMGCWQLYQRLHAWDVGIWTETLIPVILFAGLALLTYVLMNKPKVADFLISAEGEMKKVSWSSKQEIIASTIIVIVVVVCMALLLGVTDFGFQLFFSWLFT